MTTVFEPRPVPPLADAPPAPRLDVARHQHDNGLKIMAVERAGTPLVELRLRVPFAGSGASELGRARLLSETMLSGTHQRSNAELAAALQALGGALRVRADADRLLIAGQALADGLPELLALLAEVVTEAAYPDDEVAGERGRVVEELKISWAQPSILARERLLQRMFGAHPYGHEVPLPDEVAAASPEDVRGLHAERVLPQGSTLVLVGDLQADLALEQAAEALSGWKATGAAPAVEPVPALEPGPIVLVDRPGSVQSSIRIGGRGLTRSDPGYAAFQLANTVFGGYFSSRLVANIREDKGYTYSPHSVIRHAAAGSTVQLDADVASEVTAPALLEIAYELGRIATLPVTAQELEDARQYEIGSLALGIATQAGLADRIITLDKVGLEPEWLEEHPQRLAAVAVEDVLEQAAARLAPSALVTVVVGDADQVEPSMRTLGDVTRA
jgi:predicted Zn-dependent peptidase